MNNTLLRFFTNKFTVAIIVLLMLCFGVWIYFFIREGEKRNSMDAMQAIPADAAFMLRINDVNQLTRKLASDGEMPQLMRRDPNVGKMCSNLFFLIDTLASGNVAMGDLSQQPLWVSAHLFGQELSFLFSLNLPEDLYISDVRKLAEDLALRGFEPNEKPYDDEAIFTFRRKGGDLFHAAVARRVLLVSASRVLVEMAIRHAKTLEATTDEPRFLSAAKSASANVDINLYITHRKLPQLLGIFMRAGFSRQLNFLENIGEYTVLDVSLRPSEMQLSGFLFPDNLGKSYVSVLESQPRQRFASLEVLPRATDGALCIGIGKAKRLNEAYAVFRERWTSGIAKQKKQQETLKAKLGMPPEQFFEALWPTEITVAHVPMSGLSEAESWFTIINSSKPDMAFQNIIAATKRLAQVEKKPESSYVVTQNMSNGQPLTAYRNPAPGLASALMGSMFACGEEAYIVAHGTYFIFAPTMAAAKEFTMAAAMRKTLAQTAELSDIIGIDANAMLFFNLAKPNAVATSPLSETQRKAIKKSSDLLSAIPCVAAQLNVEKDRMYCNIFIKTAAHTGDKQAAQGMKQQFEVKLDAPLRAAPWMVKNHRNGHNELLAQDVNNNIYLIDTDNQGIILWKRSIGEPIMGNVQQVDYLRNKKLQLLFNTRTKLYLIDRLSRNVDRFPLSFASAATAPVAVFDYDRSRQYRYFVPCEDGDIRAYEANGKPLAGFDPKLQFGTIAHPVMHVRVEDKDYIVLADNARIYILDRKGNERVRLKEDVVPACNSVIAPDYDANGRIARLVTTTSDGRRAYIYFDGKVERDNITPKPDEQHFFAAFGHGRQATFAVADKYTLTVYNSNFGPLLSHTFRRKQTQVPQAFEPMPGKRRYAAYIGEEQKAYLLDNNGNICRGFPLSAVAPVAAFNLYNDRATYCLLVGDSAGFLTCYRYWEER